MQARYLPQQTKLSEAEANGDLRGKSEITVSNVHNLVYHNFTHFTEYVQLC
jgi:hypothetical protein